MPCAFHDLYQEILMHQIIAFIRIAIATMLFTLGAAAGVAHAGPLLWISDSEGQLGTVDTANGAVQVIGSIGTTMVDLAFDPSGHLYGTSGPDLFSIDTATALPTYIGNLGTMVTSLVFGADGTLYGADTSLYTINPTTGFASTLGNGGTSYASAGDLAFIGNALYLSSTSFPQDVLVQLDTATGAGTLIGQLGTANMYGLASNDRLTLYGVAGTEVFTIDPSSGASTLLGSYGEQGLGTAYGTAFLYESAPAIPEPSGYILAIAGLGLLGMTSGRRARTLFTLHSPTSGAAA
jgi:hypothetical protein